MYQRRVTLLVSVEFLGIALGLFGADEILQGRFAVCDGRFHPADFFFQFPDAVFHLFALEGVQAFS